MNRHFVVGLVGTVAMMVLLAVAGQHDARALSKPIQTGKSRRLVVTQTVQQVPANGQTCNVVISNLDVGTRAFPVYTGYQLPDAGSAPTQAQLVAVGQPICDNSLTALTACVGTVISQDATPTGLYVVAGTAMPDGGIPVRIQEGAGCL